jgi:hypothetical protein
MKTCFPDIKLAMERLEEIENILKQPLSPSDSSPNREQNFSPDRGSGEAEGVNAKDYHSLLEERDKLQERLRKENGYQKR